MMQEFSGVIEEVMEKLKPSTTNIIELAQTLKLQREHLQDLKDRVREIENEVRQREETLYEAMISNQIDKLAINGTTLYPLQQIWAAVPGEGEEGFQWLEKNGLTGLIRRAVNSQTLSAEIRRQIEGGEISITINPETGDREFYQNGEIIKGLNFSFKKKIGMRKN